MKRGQHQRRHVRTLRKTGVTFDAGQGCRCACKCTCAQKKAAKKPAAPKVKVLKFKNRFAYKRWRAYVLAHKLDKGPAPKIYIAGELYGTKGKPFPEMTDYDQNLLKLWGTRKK